MKLLIAVFLLFSFIYTQGCKSVKINRIETTQLKETNNMNHLKYLENINSEESLKFALENNAVSDKRLKSDPRYKTTYNEIFKILSAKDKLPVFFILNDEIYNFWQDDVHIKGILRKTSIESLNSANPTWSLIIDIDDLSKIENKNWVYRGIQCLEPKNELCLLNLSDGGKDANTLREFNLISKKFVAGGFSIPESKSRATWLNENTLLVGDGTNTSTLTTSGYPSQIKILKRGESLEKSKILFKSDKNSMAVYASSSIIDGHRYTFVNDQISFYESETYFFDFSQNKLIKLLIPKSATFEGIFSNQILFSTRDSFKSYPAGSLLSFSLDELNSNQQNITIVFKPTEKRFFQGLSQAKNYIYLHVLDDVKSKIIKITRFNNNWSESDLSIGDINGNISIATSDKNSDHIYFNYFDFLTPTSIYYINEAAFTKTPKKILQSPARFNSKNLVITQNRVKSQDGTIIPYFIVHSSKMKYNGKNPTLLYGYGGFEISMTAVYSGSIGKAWLEKGGVYVLANLRGGGEYGPSWHNTVLRENRHKVFEDFYAIAEDLIDKKITSPNHLGIKGGSNGGLLTSVAFTQRPELFNAVISEVPLANMLEYHNWLAGASWMEEYGDPSDPKMREYLLSYSPLHNLKKNKNYPEVFYLTSTKDDRVHPAHARQMVARLKELGYLVLYNENTEGGHGRATNTKDMSEFLSLEFVYLYQKLMN